MRMCLLLPAIILTGSMVHNLKHTNISKDTPLNVSLTYRTFPKRKAKNDNIGEFRNNFGVGLGQLGDTYPRENSYSFSVQFQSIPSRLTLHIKRKNQYFKVSFLKQVLRNKQSS